MRSNTAEKQRSIASGKPFTKGDKRINEDRLSGILGDLIAEAAAPVFDEAFKARAETIVKLTVRSAGLLADLIAERLRK